MTSSRRLRDVVPAARQLVEHAPGHAPTFVIEVLLPPAAEAHRQGADLYRRQLVDADTEATRRRLDAMADLELQRAAIDLGEEGVAAADIAELLGLTIAETHRLLRRPSHPRHLRAR